MFVLDKNRLAILYAVYNRISHGKSTLIIGSYGVGKSLFLKNLRPIDAKPVLIECLGPDYWILSKIAKQPVNWHNKWKVLDDIADQSGIVLIFDEANNLPPKFFPYLKRLMNAGIPCVLAGSDKLQEYLSKEHPDILSRFKTLHLESLALDELTKALENVEADAVKLLYGTARGNMRIFQELLDDCEDKRKELQESRITLDIAQDFV